MTTPQILAVAAGLGLAALALVVLRAAWNVRRGPGGRVRCTHWRGGSCLDRVESAPEGCLVRRMLEGWYEGRSCARCGWRFEGVVRSDWQPAFLDHQGRILAWEDVAAERLPEALAGYRPVCWNCRVVDVLRREHGELFADRGPGGPPPERHA